MATPPPTKIEFLPYHQPALDDGDYTITISQAISDTAGKIKQTPFQKQQRLSILGPRFSLDPQEIVAVFPPAGSLGEHSNVLPHLTLKRSTLPWEREADHASADLPWLALLLFSQDETPTIETITLADLGFPNQTRTAKVPANILFPRFSSQKLTEPYLIADKGQQPDDKVTVIYVKPSLLKQQLPIKEGLKWLAHVRQGTNEQGQPLGDEMATLIGNRLPKAGERSTVHLVSLEGLYNDGGFVYRDQDDSQAVCLVSLKSWRFTCLSERHSFKGLLLHLNHQLLFNLPLASCQSQLNQGVLADSLLQAFQRNKHPLTNPTITARAAWRVVDGNMAYFVGTDNHVYNQAGKFLFTLRTQPGPVDSNFNASGHSLSAGHTLKVVTDSGPWWMNDGQQGYFLRTEGDRLYVYQLAGDSSATLRLPRQGATSEPYLQQGFVPAVHTMRQGNRTVSWYHGPLRPGQVATATLPLPTRSADQLAVYDPAGGLFDLSYAAAWELGRLLTLQNQGVSVALFNWKRSHAQQVKEAQARLTHLPFARQAKPLAFPATVADWFNRLGRLEGIPFTYLVPHPAMLPPETIRFFWLDPLWVDALLDGAFSIGRVSDTQLGYDQQNQAMVIPAGAAPPITGFLLRSDVVSGWPGLLVEGCAKIPPPAAWRDFDADQKLEVIRFERLAANVLLCLFTGRVAMVDIHQKPETLHFGLSRPEPDGNPNYHKVVRGGNGQTVNVVWQNQGQNIVDMTQTAQAIAAITGRSPFTPAQFALQMIEGVEKVRFLNGE